MLILPFHYQSIYLSISSSVKFSSTTTKSSISNELINCFHFLHATEAESSNLQRDSLPDVPIGKVTTSKNGKKWFRKCFFFFFLEKTTGPGRYGCTGLSPKSGTPFRNQEKFFAVRPKSSHHRRLRWAKWVHDSDAMSDELYERRDVHIVIL